MRLGFETEFEDDKFLGEYDFVLADILGEGLKVDYFANEGFVLLIEVSLDFFLILDK